MSDVFMRNVFKKRECTEYVLQVIMGKKDLKVLNQVIQMDYKNLQGRSAILDCVARDADGKQFDVEIQQDNEGASPKRARYHSGLMDMNTLNAGQDFGAARIPCDFHYKGRCAWIWPSDLPHWKKNPRGRREF